MRRALFPEVFAVFGPTATGKSAVCDSLADRLGTEVVSADAMQVYRGLPILTNQPERPTRLVAVRDLDEEMSVGEYAALAHDAIDELVESRGSVVVGGGTGLYLRASLVDLNLPPAPPPGAREAVEAVYDADPNAAHARLALVDPRAAAAVHATDRRRVVRALELAELGSSLAPEENRLWSNDTRRPTLVAGLDVPSDILERRIRVRAERMLERGVVGEVRCARAGGISRTAEQALGLEELSTLPADEALERIVLRTRRYAAYQRKWMRRIPSIVMIGADRPRTRVRMRFSKWHALGNSYLLVERAGSEHALAPADALRLCDPHHGVGADGVLEVTDVRGAEADVVVWNPDGSRAELSGNGARIAAMWLARRSGVAFPRIHLGERVVPARVDGDEVEVDLGTVHVGRPEALNVSTERIEVTPVSVGNPHAVVRREPSREELRRLGPLIERHERFPERTNVQLVRADGPHDLTVAVWERGAGETLASGSSAAAAASAAVVHGWCTSPVRVHLPGGTLTVDVREGRAILSGPVMEIFRGETVEQR